MISYGWLDDFRKLDFERDIDGLHEQWDGDCAHEGEIAEGMDNMSLGEEAWRAPSQARVFIPRCTV